MNGSSRGLLARGQLQADARTWPRLPPPGSTSRASIELDLILISTGQPGVAAWSAQYRWPPGCGLLAW